MSHQRTLTAEDFGAFFAELHGDGQSTMEPFPWQVRLVERLLDPAQSWPEALALPTGAGKTACIEIALFVLAAQTDWPAAERTAPRRIFFVVDRRIVVDAAYERARKVGAALEAASTPVVARVAQSLQSIGDPGVAAPISCYLLRGGVYRDDRWVRSPLQPTVICSTVDQVGSRLLFRGYGLRSGSMWPVHAALAANDSLLLLDEAHCARPFRQTLEAVAKYRRWYRHGSDPETPFACTMISATPPVGCSDVVRADEADRTHRVLGPRLRASKPARLEQVSKARGEQALERLADAIARAVDDPTGAHQRVAAVVNRVATARAVARRVTQRCGDRADVVLMTGRMRELDRRDLVERDLDHLWSERPRAAEQRPTVVVATRSDGRNLRVANLLRARADVGRVLVLVNSPGRVEAFSEAGHEPVCATTALSKTLVDCL